MINVEITEEKDSVRVDVVKITNSMDIINGNWENQLKQFAEQNKKVVFHIEEPDNDGFYMNIVRFWLRYADKALVLSENWIVKRTLKTNRSDKVIEFV